jgi:hypothetical protein
MTVGIAFLIAFFGIAIIGVAAKFIIGLFSVTRPARFGGFCIALGFALAHYSFGGPVNRDLLIPASSALGAVVALIGLWYWLVAKEATPPVAERE